MIRSFIIFVTLTLSLVSCLRKGSEAQENYLVVPSLDGFQWNFPYILPNQDAFLLDFTRTTMGLYGMDFMIHPSPSA